MGKEQIVVGLEVGTSKTCAIVGELREDGNVAIIGVGQSPSQGVRKGEIVDMEAALQSIHTALNDAEESAQVEIHNVYVSVTGGHLRSFNNRGRVMVTHEDRLISEDEVRSVMQNAKSVSVPVDSVVVHAIRQSYTVDGQDEVQNPVGMIGTQLEADVHIIFGQRNRLSNTIHCVRQVPLDVSNITVASFASALALLTTENQQLGALVIDMGGGTADYIVYREGVVYHSGILAVGGDHITNDIALGLRIPMGRAENMKIEHGSVEVPDTDELITIKREVTLPDLNLSRRQLCRIMNLRVEETLSIIKRDLEERKLLEYLGAGVFITGGCARLRGLSGLAEQVFGMPVTVGQSCTVGGPTSAIESPEYSTAIGLLKFAQSAQRHEHLPPQPGERIFKGVKDFFAKVRANFM
jgi:cell division protein FtsA